MSSLALTKSDLLSELSVKESILGLMKTRDHDGDGFIHSSDFRSVIDEVGMDMGNKLVQNILVKCGIDTKGNINYTTLARALSDERSIILAKQAPKTLQTSLTAVEKPLRADVAHKQQLQGEKNARSLQANRLAVLDLYQRYVHTEIDEDELISEITGYDINITSAFQTLLRKHHAARSAPVADVFRSLSTVESSTDNLSLVAASGERKPNSTDGDIQDMYRRRRFPNSSNVSSMGQMLADTYEVPMHKTKPLRKFEVTSDEIMSAFSADDSPVPFATMNQEVYAGGSISAPSTFSFTSELKMTRERVLAGLRQVDTGEVSPSTFQGMLFEMGIEPPELLLTMIQRKNNNGTLDWKKIVRLLDDRVFKPMAMQTRDVADAGLDPLKNKFLDSLRNRGCRSLSDLAGAFRLASIDTDGSIKMLSFADVKKSYRSLGLSDLSDDELRQFMVAFDKTGAGQIDTEKLLSFLRGPLSQQRNKFILWAFRSMDKQGISEFSVELFVSIYDASFHPDVLNGLVTEKKVLLSFLNSFGSPKDISSTITRDEFFDFLGNLSVFIEDDDVFERMVKGSFNLGDKAPAPPEYQSSFGFEKAAFSGKQHHGDILSWSQEPSVLEKKSPEKTKKVARDFDRTFSVRSEFDRATTASYKNSSSLSQHLTWNQPKSPPKQTSAAKFQGFHPDPNLSVSAPQEPGVKTTARQDRNFSTSCPFGRDIVVAPGSAVRSGGPRQTKSLAEHMNRA